MIESSYEGESLRFRTPVQALILCAVIAVLAYAVIEVADGWADWVILGVLIVTTFGFAVAVHHRQYPTKKRSYTRGPDSRW